MSRKQTACFDEHGCSSSQDSISWAVEVPCVLFTTSLTVSRVSVVIWVALGVISQWVVAVVATVFGVTEQVTVGAQGANNPIWMGRRGVCVCVVCHCSSR